ncbi:hypothetical protein SAMN04487948_103230 [Halogranum amylolyticum]|uniref:RecA-superfamily ATPase, KaiC/GvpD/RAD55 family n=1 Tax=Halogranum amylolyticum TaxID=660520 RepID=A0A1H8QPJ7_9EURY|nr:hypothetical protein [Halogranum amylolyticum]SEO55976.1 hypothetical protein SAMN04487948_103230 [Halogranum amylolyticum]
MKANRRQFTGDDVLEKASSVLLLSPSLSDDEAACCTDLLQPTDDPPGNLLWVAYTRSPDSLLRRWQTHGCGRPANLGIVSVGESARSAAAARPDETPLSGPVETIANPTDLTGLGIRLNDYLRRWDDNDYPTTVCLDSLTAMLQYVDVETVYQFLHVLSGRFYAAGARAHFHVDPDAHDEQTVERLVSLCDVAVDLSGEEWTVRSR